MDAVPQERTLLFGILTGLTLTFTVALLAWRYAPIVPVWSIIALGTPWMAFSIFLRIRRADLGREGRFLDLWSIPHLFGGVLLGLFGLGFVWIAILVVWWEGVEHVSRVFEYTTNRITDCVIAVAGWALAQYIVTGGFALA
jgi:hypothetical protein